MEMKATDVFYKIKHVYNKTKIKKIRGVNKVVKKYRFIINKGGSRSSKTYSLLQFFVYLMMSQKNQKITVWRNEKTTCKATCMEDFAEIIANIPGMSKFFDHNKTLSKFTCKRTGSFIIFEGGDNANKVHGLKQNISFFNEVSEFSLKVYQQIAQRTSDTIFFDYNPSKTFWLDKFVNNDKAVFLHSTYLDNAFVSDEIAEQLESYCPWHEDDLDLPVEDRRPHPVNVLNGTADEYMYRVYCLGEGAEKPGKIYKGWQKITDKMFDDLPYQSYIGHDFGSSKPSANVEVKFDGNRSIFIKEKLYKPINDLEGGSAAEIKLANMDLDIKSTIIVADSAKEAYINALQSASLSCIGADKESGSVCLGIEIIQKLKVYYTDSSTNIEHEYDLYSWIMDKFGDTTDAPLKQDDHLMDAIRYVVRFIMQVNNK